MRRDLGDFQTPPELAAEVLDCLGPIGRRWSRVLEPTCGQGHFIAGLLAQRFPPKRSRRSRFKTTIAPLARSGLTAVTTARRPFECESTRLICFAIDLQTDLTWQTSGPLLVVGNPPWVTSAELGQAGGDRAAAHAGG